jgi:hypothetical protein
MSGEGATGPAFDAAGNALRINPGRGGMALYNPANIKVPDVAEMTHEGDILQFKMWLRHLSLLLSSAGMDVVLYAEVYDHASAKHREALGATVQHISLHCIRQSELECTLHCLNQKMPCYSLFWIWTYLFLR